MKSSRAIGVIEILASGFCFGFLGIFGKGAFTLGLSPGEVLSLRFTFAGLIVLITLAATQRKRLNMGRQGTLWSIILGVLGYAVFSFCYFQALNGLSASLTVLLLYMYPVMVPIGARIFLGEHIPKERWLVLPLAMIGLILLVWGEFYVRNPISLGFGFASAFFYSIYILCSRKFLANVDSLPSAGIMQLSAGLTIGLFHWHEARRVMEIITVAWPYILGLSIVCSIAAMSLFLMGLKKLKSWEVSILSTSEPVTAILLATLLLGERLTSQQTIGAGLVLTSLVIVSLPTRGARLRS